MYSLVVERSAERDLKALPLYDYQRIIAAIRSLADVPRPVGCRKLAGWKNAWRIRIGDRRVLYEVDDAQRIVRIVRVGHRRDIYR